MSLEDLGKLGIQQINETVQDSGMTGFQSNLLSGGKKALAGASLFVGATSMLDFAVTAKRNKENRRMIEEQEKNTKKKMKEENKVHKKIHRDASVNHVNVGETVFDMFEQRTGHHKMGQSKNSSW